MHIAASAELLKPAGVQMTPLLALGFGDDAIGYVFPAGFWSCFGLFFSCYVPIWHFWNGNELHIITI